MANPFSHLPKNASPNTIYGEAGKVFAARKARNPQTNFDTEVWYLAQDAIRCGFYDLSGMTTEQVASSIASSILNHVRAEDSNRQAQEAKRQKEQSTRRVW